ncbi:MAG TPA: terminase TerL endonuclease subunit [Planctomycetota bacterium]|nr:terminase TerL endonuclease subunit [Planctomycetota bacterium]
MTRSKTPNTKPKARSASGREPQAPRPTPSVDPRWIRTASDRAAVDAGCTFDLARAERVRAFFRKFLVHSKGSFAGQPFVLLDWQWDEIIAPLFGWIRPDGTRRFREAYIEVAKKNGKSALCSGLALYMLVGDGEQGAEVYSAAADREQASIIFNEAANMAAASPALSKHLMITPSTKHIAFPRTRSRFKALSADAYSNEGLNASAILFDELHAQRDRKLWDALKFAGAARRQPLNLSITTAGFDKKSICWERHEYAEKIISGSVIDTRCLAVIHAADELDDPYVESTWRKANPSLGATITLESMGDAAAEAKANPSSLNAFLRYRLNIWTAQDVKWLDMQTWKLGERPIDVASLGGRACWGAIDLSSKYDLTALTLAFPEEMRDDKGQPATGYILLCHFWLPRATVEKSDLYKAWERQGLLHVTEGNVIDYDFIRGFISGPQVYGAQPGVLARVKAAGLPAQGLVDVFSIQEMAFDPYNATQLSLQLAGDGIPMVEFRQGFISMNEPSKEFERCHLAGLLWHDHPVLTWCAENVSIQVDPAGNIKPTKPDPQSADKVDGVTTSVMAIGRAMFSDAGGSVYDDEGLMIL